MNSGAIAYEYGPNGQLKALVPVPGVGCPNSLEWRDQTGAKCDPPEKLSDAWRVLNEWIEGHRKG